MSKEQALTIMHSLELMYRCGIGQLDILSVLYRKAVHHANLNVEQTPTVERCLCSLEIAFCKSTTGHMGIYNTIGSKRVLEEIKRSYDIFISMRHKLESSEIANDDPSLRKVLDEDLPDVILQE
jgi:hypothetical protein